MGMSALYIVGSAATEQSNLLGSLGIDTQLLILQSIAFLLLLLVLSKWVFPVFRRMLEKREQQIEESLKAAKDAEQHAAEAEANIASMMKDARSHADEIIASAKSEASAMVAEADKKAKDRAEQLVSEAEAEIQRNVENARTELRKETLELVAEATEKVVGATVGERIDKKIVQKAVQEAKS